jgi:hypothetical protein
LNLKDAHISKSPAASDKKFLFDKPIDKIGSPEILAKKSGLLDSKRVLRKETYEGEITEELVMRTPEK